MRGNHPLSTPYSTAVFSTTLTSLCVCLPLSCPHLSLPPHCCSFASTLVSVLRPSPPTHIFCMASPIQETVSVCLCVFLHCDLHEPPFPFPR